MGQMGYMGYMGYIKKSVWNMGYMGIHEYIGYTQPGNFLQFAIEAMAL